MIKIVMVRLISLVLCLFAINGFAHEWEKIAVPNVVTTVIDANGEDRYIKPGCAFSYLEDGAGLPNQPFHFYYKKGKKKDKTLIYFNGGGACWNDATCLTSLTSPERLGQRPVYNPSILLENTPEEVGGILNQKRRENPVKDWNIVFIPYCTGDAHIGSRDAIYADPLELVNGGQPLMVQHRGFDNFMAVREWVKNHTRRSEVKTVLIAGSSAGSYGALLNFPRLRDLYSKKARVMLLADAGTGVFTQPFIDLVFNNPEPEGGPWGATHNLPTWIAGIDQQGSFSADTFYPEIVTGLARTFPKSYFAQYTSAWDSVQVFFLNIMQKTDAGSVDPLDWNSISTETWLEWHNRMRHTLDTIARKRNSSYYIGAGIFHAGLIDIFRPGYFYEESSAGGVFLTDWVKRLVDDNKKIKLPNLICSDDCGAPFAQ